MKPTVFTILFSLLAFSSYSQATIVGPVKKYKVWELLAKEGKYHKAIDTLHYFLEKTDSLNEHAENWHLGQYYASINDYDSAIKYFRKSSNCFHRLVDREWRLYFKGTVAFLKRNDKKLKRISERLWRIHSAYYEGNAIVIKQLYDNFDKNYMEAYESVFKR